jgi:hypothetical protein
MTLLKELIEIPEHVDKGQFVLRLSEGVTDPAATVKAYVVTDNLVDRFSDALELIKAAVSERTSKAAYLLGSFGSGKSHFMAILHLILNNNSAAKGIIELADVITNANKWTAGNKFLLVPYHMIGANDVESGILGGYVDYIRRHHPDAPIPGVYKAERLFQDAENLRQTMGDEAFFTKLNETSSDDEQWGDLAAAWDATRFEQAQNADPASEERSQLISALVGSIFASYGTQVSDRAEAFLSLDEGLSVISKHAQSLGYTSLILFLDELILWLAGHSSDLSFINDQLPKLTKLVEAQSPDRPIPIVSFIARQRDLAELIGDSVPGVEKVSFNDQLNYHKGRFNEVELSDRNLPAIAEKRVLRCKSDAARTELDMSFQQTVDQKLLKLLMPSDYDKEQFRQVYPFSPALVQTLIAVSSMLQRERTALKVMLQLLVNQRDTLEVGDLVPVGDLFDVIAHGDEALSPELAVHFDNAKKLYHNRLQPLLEDKYGPAEELQKRDFDDPHRRGFRDDDRLVKTLLLSALVPDVEALQGLTADRLAVLNHGTIKTPIPGQEAQEALRRCREWAAQVGEIRVGEGTNPTISVQLSGVDTEAILRQADAQDSPGNRTRLVRQILADQIGITDDGEFEKHYTFLWKQTRRSCDLLFRNVRELNDTSLENDLENDWRIIVDTPFDEPGRGPRDDIGKIQDFQQTHPEGAKTLCWLPQFFNDAALNDLGKLVKLNHILTGERLREYSAQLSPQDRQSAKTLLENQQSTLKQRVEHHVLAAYGIIASVEGSLETNAVLDANEQFQSLLSGFQPRPPVAPNLRDALDQLLGQALSHDYPAAPAFEDEVKTANLNKVCEVVREAARVDKGRLEVDKSLRRLVRAIAGPLQLGEMGHDATHFVLGQHWKNHFQREAVQAGGELTVGDLRKWIDEPKSMGLPRDAQNLVILCFVEQENYALLRHGSAVDAKLTDLSDDCVLRKEELPEDAVWQEAVQRAASILGIAISKRPSAQNVAQLSTKAREKVLPSREQVQKYTHQLADRLQKFEIDPEQADRHKTATAVLQLAEQIYSSEGLELIRNLAAISIESSEAAMGACLNHAATLREKIENFKWELLETAGGLAGEYRHQADELTQSLKNAFEADEQAINLAVALEKAEAQALRIINQALKAPEPEPAPPSAPIATPKPQPAWKVVTSDQRENLEPASAHQTLTELEGQQKEGQRVRVNVSWVVEQQQQEEQESQV